MKTIGAGESKRIVMGIDQRLATAFRTMHYKMRGHISQRYARIRKAVLVTHRYSPF
jgi:hypothetical protein